VPATCCDDLATALGAARRQALADGHPFRGLVAALPGERDEDVLPGVPRPGGRLQ
jgi:hypothetical protein